jgi:DNA-binding protein H-NS
MATMDLSNFNLGELKALLYDIEKEIKDRQQQEVKKARNQILLIAQDLGVSVADLLANKPKRRKAEKAGKTPPQYKNPADSSQTWSGRGRQPRWLVDGLKSGKTLDDFRIS